RPPKAPLGSFGETATTTVDARRLGADNPVPHWLRLAPRALGSFGERPDGWGPVLGITGRSGLLGPDSPGRHWLRSARQALGSLGDGYRVRSASGVECDSPPTTHHPLLGSFGKTDPCGSGGERPRGA